MSEIVQREANVIDKVHASSSGLAAALADRIGVDRFTRAAVTALRTTPTLARCSHESILGGLFLAAQLGLEIGGPLAYAHLVPYGKDAQLVVGVRGFIELFYRAGAKVVRADVVRQGDSIRQATDETGRVRIAWESADPLDDERPLIGALASVVLASGEVLQHIMSRKEIDARRPRTSKAGPWSDWYEEMAKKTVLRQLAKTARLSSDDLALAVEADQTITTGTDENAKRRHVPVGGADDEPIDLFALPQSDDPLSRTPEELSGDQAVQS